MLIAVTAAPLRAGIDYPVTVAAGSQSLTVPWHTGPVGDRFNPAFSAGLERTLRDSGRLRYYHTLNIGYFRNYWWMTAVTLDMELGAGARLPWNLFTDLKLGLGYMHYFSRRKKLELQDGEYVAVTDLGKPSAVIPLSLLVGYRGLGGGPVRFSPFLCAKWAVQTPFSHETPAMTHFFVSAGVRLSWGDCGGEGAER